MRRGIIRAAIAVLLLLLIFWGFLEYRQYASFKAPMVHKDADLIIKLNVDKLITKVAFNALANPSYYINSLRRDSSTSDGKTRFKGLKLPANLFFYSLKDQPGTFFTSLNISNSDYIEDFLVESLKIDGFEDKRQYFYGVGRNGKVQVVYNDRKIVLSYSISPVDTLKILSEILLEEDAGTPDQTLISGLQKAKGDLVAINDNSHYEFDFEKGKVVFNGIVDGLDFLSIPSKTNLGKNDPNCGIHIQLAADPKSEHLKDFTVNGLKIPLDSLLAYYHGYLDIKVAGKAVQRDTIVVFDYNDDFEKVETKILQQSEVPGLKITLNGDAFHLNRLLQKENIILENKINRAYFPLYDLEVDETQGTKLVFFNNIEIRDTEQIGSNDFFSVAINFGLLQKYQNLPVPVEYWSNLEKLNLSASENNQSMKIKGSLVLVNENLNAFFQFFDEVNNNGE